ncbi:MAG: hypothetical protein AAF289_11120 [Cyanobacteria bacterium P01_A01_bin.135]
MKRLLAGILLATAVSSSLVNLAKADQQQTSSESPIIAQLQLRDRTVTITAAPEGHRYSVADESGEILSAALKEEQLAEQYPELFDLLQPAVAEDDLGPLMLAPAMTDY